MSTLRASRPVAVLLLLTLWPALGLAQSAPPAGVVTGLQGTARLTRPVVAQPIQLKFKDDLFLRDQVETRENSVVRVLLAGKALVTIRELSTFTITEEPGRAAVDLKSGKIAVGVAKSLLKPGEAIEIRTPNAIAAVRGSLLIASVVVSGGVPQSSFIALDASLPITVTPLGGSAAAAVALNANQAVGVSGTGATTAVGPVQTITPEVARREAQTASAPRAADGQGTSSPMAAQISVAKAQEAAMLAALIAPGPTGGTPPPADATLASATQAQLLQEQGSNPISLSTPTTPPPSTGNLGVNATSTTEAVASEEGTSPDPGDGASPPPPPPPPPALGPVVINNQTLVLGTGATVTTFSGAVSSAETAPWVTVNNSTVTGPDNLIVVEPGGTVNLAGPLLNVTDSAITTNNRLLFLDGGTLTSSTTSPFLFFDPSTVTSGGQMLLLLNDANLSLAGPLVAAQSTAFTAGNPALTAASLLTIVDGSTLTSTSTAPLISFDASSFDGGTMVSVRRSPSTLNRSTLTLAGPLFSAVNESLVDTSSLGLGATVGTAGGPCCSLVSVTQGGQLSSTTTNPLIQATGSILRNGPDAQSGGSIVNIADTSTGLPATELVAPSSMSLAGPLLRSDSSTLTALFHLLRVGSSTFVSTTTNPLIQLNNSIVNLGGFDPFANATSVARVLNLSGTAATPGNLTLQGPLFAASGSQVSTTSEAFGIFAGGHLNVATTAAPLISVAGGGMSSGSNFLHVSGFAAGGSVPATLSLSGALFSANGAAITPIGNLVRIADGGSVSSTTTAPFVTFNGGSFTGGGAVNTASGGSLLRMFSQAGQTGTSLTLAGPYFASSGGAPFVTTDSHTFNIADGATLVSTTTSPFASFLGGSVTSAFSFFGLDSHTSFGSPVTTGNGVAPNVSIAGTLIEGSNTTFATPNGSFFFMRAGASLNQSGSAPLLRLTASAPNGTIVNSAFNFVSLFSGPDLAAPSLSLGGPLLTALNTSITNGDPTANTHPTVFIGDGSIVVSTTPSPFLSFDASSVDASSGMINVGRSRTVANPTRLTLSGPLFTAVNGSSFNTTSLGFSGGIACCTAFFFSQAAEVVSSTTAPFIQLTNSSFNAGPDAQSGSNFMSVTDAGAAGDLIAPTKVTLAGPVLGATNSNVSSLFNLLSVTRSELSTSSNDPLIQLSGTNANLGGLNPFGNVQTTGRLLVLVSSATGGTVGFPATLSLNGAGPLLAATNSTLSMTSDVIGIFNGAALTSAATVPLVQLTGGTLTTQSAGGFGGYVLTLGNTGGPTGAGFATAQLGGALLRTTDGALNLSGGILNVFSGGQVTTNGSTNPFAFVDGGVHTIAGNPSNAAAFSLFSLSGRSTASALDAESGLILGTDRPLQGPAQLNGTRPVLTPLLETTGATINSQRALWMDNALLEATAPLLNLTPKGSTQSVLTTNGFQALELCCQASVTALGSSVIRLDNSVLNVNGGSLLHINGGKLSASGDLVTLLNGSTLNIASGALIFVNGFARVNGGLINFGGTGGNTVNITNNFCPCTIIGGVPVALQNGALVTNVQVSNPIKNPSLGTLNLSPNAALAVVSGAGSKLIVGPQ